KNPAPAGFFVPALPFSPRAPFSRLRGESMRLRATGSRIGERPRALARAGARSEVPEGRMRAAFAVASGLSEASAKAPHPDPAPRPGPRQRRGRSGVYAPVAREQHAFAPQAGEGAVRGVTQLPRRPASAGQKTPSPPA